MANSFNKRGGQSKKAPSFFEYENARTFMKEVRIKHDKSVEEIASLLEVNSEYIKMIEAGLKTPTVDKFAEFAAHFGFNLVPDFPNWAIKFTGGTPFEEQDSYMEVQPSPMWIKEVLEKLQDYVDMNIEIFEALHHHLDGPTQDYPGEQSRQIVTSFDEIKKQLVITLQKWDQINQY